MKLANSRSSDVMGSRRKPEILMKTRRKGVDARLPPIQKTRKKMGRAGATANGPSPSLEAAATNRSPVREKADAPALRFPPVSEPRNIMQGFSRKRVLPSVFRGCDVSENPTDGIGSAQPPDSLANRPRPSRHHHPPADMASHMDSESRLMAAYQTAVVDGDVARQAMALRCLGDFQLRVAHEKGWQTGVLPATALYTAALSRSASALHKAALWSRLREVEGLLLGVTGGHGTPGAGSGRHDVADAVHAFTGLGPTSGSFLKPDFVPAPASVLPRRMPEEVARRTRESLQRTREWLARQVVRVEEMRTSVIQCQEQQEQQQPQQQQQLQQQLQPDIADVRVHEAEVRREIVAMKKRVKQDMVKLFQSLAKEASQALGPAPSKYAVLALGHLAQDEVTPFSGFRGVVVVEDGASGKDTTIYFHRLAAYIQFKVLNLGETPLATSGGRVMRDIYNASLKALYDPVITGGVSMDPPPPGMRELRERADFAEMDHGNPSAVIVVRSRDLVSALTSCLTAEHHHVVVELLQNVFVDGDHELHQMFKEELEGTFLSNPERRSELCSLMMARLDRLGCFQLRPDYYSGAYHLHMPALQSDLGNASAVLCLLKLTYNAAAGQSLKIIDELRAKLIVSDDGEADLKSAFALIYYINCCLCVRIQGPVSGAFGEGLFLTVDGSRSNLADLIDLLAGGGRPLLQRVYATIIPLLRHLRSTTTTAKKAVMSHLTLNVTDAKTEALVQYRLSRLPETITCLQRAIKDHDGSLSAVEMYETVLSVGLIYLEMRDTSAARVYFSKAIDLKDNIQEQGTRTLLVSRVWVHLGLVFLEDSELDKARRYFTEALDMYSDLVGHQNSMETDDPEALDFLILAHKGMALVNRIFGNEKARLEHLQILLDMESRRWDFQHDSVSRFHVLQDAGLSCLARADFKGAHYYFKQALVTASNLWSPNQANIGLASVQLYLGQAADGLGKKTLAQFYKISALCTVECLLGIPSQDYDVNGVVVFTGCARGVLGAIKVLIDCRQAAARDGSDDTNGGDDTHSLLRHCIRLVTSPGDHVSSSYEEATLVATQGRVFHNRKQHSEALERYNSARDSFEKLFTGSDAHNARAYDTARLSAACIARQGRTDEALRHLVMILTNIRTHMGDNECMTLQLAVQQEKVQVFCLQQEYDKAIGILHHCIEMQRQIFGATHPKVAESFRQIGKLQCVVCDFDGALGSLTQALDMYYRLYGEHTPTSDLAEVYLDLGKTYQGAERLSAAERSFIKAVETQKEVHGAAVPSQPTIDALVALGDYYQGVEAFRQAIRYHKEAVDLGRKLHGMDSLQAAELTACIAYDHAKQDAHAEARKFFEAAVKVGCQLSETEAGSLKLAQWMKDLARVYEKIGVGNLAKEYYAKALAMRKKMLGVGSVDVENTDSLSILADHLEQKGQYQRAIPLRKRALTHAQKLLGEDDPQPEILEGLRKITEDLIHVGNFGLAGHYGKKLGKLLQIRYGRDSQHQDVAYHQKLCGRIHDGLSQFEAALGCYEKAKTMYDSLSESDAAYRSDTVSCLLELVRCLLNIGRTAEAANHMEKAVAICAEFEKCKENTDVVASTYMTMGWAKEMYPNHREALTYYKKAHRLFGRLHKECNQYGDKVALALNAMGRGHCALGSFDKGVDLLEKSVEAFQNESTEDAKRDSLLDVHFDLAKAYLSGGRVGDSVQAMQKVLHMGRQKYGVERPHLQIANYLCHLAEALRQAGEHAEAVVQAQQAVAIYRKVLQKHADHPTVAAMVVLIGDCQLSMLRYDEALKSYKDASLMQLNLNDCNAFSPDVEKCMVKLRQAQRALAEQ